MKMLLISLLSLAAVNVFGASRYLDSERLYQCGGSVELREAGNGDLALKFEGGIDKSYCSGLRFVDVTSGRVIKSYPFQGSSYTLSKRMESELGKDCAVEFQLTNGRGRVIERKQIVLGWWSCLVSRPSQPSYPSYPSYGRTTYEWSNNNNCKIMVDGVYTGRNTPEHQEYLCGARPGRVTYEWSNKGNCKIMINGQYSGQNTPKHEEYKCRR